jgi:hypothetical protein
MSALQWAALALAVALTLAGLALMVFGVVQQLRTLRTQLRQEWRPPATSRDPELAQRAQELLDELCARAGEPHVDVTVVPILGRPAPASVAGLGTGGPAMTRFRLNQPASIMLASGARGPEPGRAWPACSPTLAHAATYATRRSVLRHYAVAVPFFVTIPVMIWVARAASVSVALPVAALAAALVLAWWTWLSRRQEIAADLYAIELTGDLAGAAELMDLYVSARPKNARLRSLIRALEGYFETHPAPETRLEAMRRHLIAR